MGIGLSLHARDYQLNFSVFINFSANPDPRSSSSPTPTPAPWPVIPEAQRIL